MQNLGIRGRVSELSTSLRQVQRVGLPPRRAAIVSGAGKKCERGLFLVLIPEPDSCWVFRDAMLLAAI